MEITVLLEDFVFYCLKNFMQKLSQLNNTHFLLRKKVSTKLRVHYLHSDYVNGTCYSILKLTFNIPAII